MWRPALWRGSSRCWRSAAHRITRPRPSPGQALGRALCRGTAGTGEPDAARSHGAPLGHARRQKTLRPAQAHPGAGLRHHQIGSGLSTIPAARARQGSRRVEPGDHGLEHEADLRSPCPVREHIRIESLSYRDGGGRRRRFTGWRNAKRRFVAQSAKLQSDRLLGLLTANATTPYSISFVNLAKTGPLVVEIPAGAIAGGILDVWQRPITDTGALGPKHIRPEERKWAGQQPGGLAYWEVVARVINEEPPLERDRITLATLVPLGIEKGKPFNPDARQKAILEQASNVGELMARANGYAKRFPGSTIWPGKHWEYSLYLKETDQEVPTHTQLDERASWFYEAVGVTVGMMGRTVGAGQVYLESSKDAAGKWLEGDKSYTLHVPKDAPVAQFWSFTVYDQRD